MNSSKMTIVKSVYYIKHDYLKALENDQMHVEGNQPFKDGKYNKKYLQILQPFPEHISCKTWGRRQP